MTDDLADGLVDEREHASLNAAVSDALDAIFAASGMMWNRDGELVYADGSPRSKLTVFQQAVARVGRARADDLMRGYFAAKQALRDWEQRRRARLQEREKARTTGRA